MKKYLVILLALFLAVPAVSYAGSVTSRYDVTIGGYVKFDVAYADQNISYDYRAPQRDGRSTWANNAGNAYDTVTWAGGETRLNFAIKGPDAWGAKTSALVEGDFRGGTGQGQGGASYGYFTLRHAFMNMDWGNTQLLVGHTWQAWGLLPTFNILAFSENHFMKGATRVPQIRLTQKFTKDLAMVVGLASPENTFGTNGTAAGSGGINANWSQVSDKNRALYPDTSIEFQYKSAALGKIGPWGLTMGLGGMVGKERVTYQYPANHYRSTPLRRWGSSFYGYIPIIPEKANNKAGALAFTGNVFMGQGLGIYLPAAPQNPYDRPADTTVNNAASGYVSGDPTLEVRYPMTSGGWAQMTFYYTDKMFSNLLFGWQKNSLSQRYINANAGAVRYLQNWVFNVMYDVSPAVRFGAEYTRVMGSYAQYTTTGKPSGTFNAVRLGAYYYF